MDPPPADFDREPANRLPISFVKHTSVITQAEVVNYGHPPEGSRGHAASPDVLLDSAIRTQQVVGAWVARALLPARVERILDPEGFCADVPEVWGAWGFGETTEAALIDLEPGLEGWVTLKVADGDDDIPDVGGIRLGP